LGIGHIELPPDASLSDLTFAMRNPRGHSLDRSIHFICMDWRHMAEMLAAGDEIYDSLKD
jgi:hypothetical protein